MCNIKNQENNSNTRFALYSFTYLILGSLFMAIGPLIPYYAQRENRTQSQYSVVLFARSIGYIVGALMTTFAYKHLTIHQCLAIGLVIGGIFSIIFNYTSDLLYRSIYFFFLSVGMAFFDISCNAGTVQAFKKDNFQTKLQILHASLGVGGLIIPIVIHFISFKTYLMLGIIQLILAPIVLFMRSPESSLLKRNQQNIQPQQIQPQQNPQPEQSVHYISKKMIILISISYLLIYGLQATFGGWFSSYIVIRHLDTKQNAPFYSTVFYISITFFRFLFVFIKGKAITKIGSLSLLGFIGSIVSLILIYQTNIHIGLILSAIIIGLSNSAIFALLLTIPSEFGMQVTQAGISIMMLFATLGQGIISVIVGSLLDITAPEILFYSISITFLLVFINNFKIYYGMLEELEEIQGKDESLGFEQPQEGLRQDENLQNNKNIDIRQNHHNDNYDNKGEGIK